MSKLLIVLTCYLLFQGLGLLMIAADMKPLNSPRCKAVGVTGALSIVAFIVLAALGLLQVL